MKVVILEGRLTTWLIEETISKPKQIVEIKEISILQYIMRTYNQLKLMILSSVVGIMVYN